MKTILTALVAALSLTGCNAAPSATPPTDSSPPEPTAEVLKLFGGRTNFDVIAKATDVRVAKLKRKQNHPSTAALEAYDVVGEPRSLDQKQRRELTALLTAPTSYLWDRAVGCIPDYGSQIEFQLGQDTVLIAVCMQCQLLYVYRDGRPIGAEEFNPITSELSRLIQ